MNDSHLLRLPAELRIQIFESVVILSQRIKLGLDKDCVHLMKSREFKNLLPLTETSRQLRKEVLPMVYGLNTFRISTWGNELRDATSIIDKWLSDGLGEGLARLLRRVELEMEYTPTEVLGSLAAIAEAFGRENLKCMIYLNAIWTEDGYERCVLPVHTVLQGGKLKVGSYKMNVETAVDFQRDVLKHSQAPFGTLKQYMRDLKEAKKELLSLPTVLE